MFSLGTDTVLFQFYYASLFHLVCVVMVRLLHIVRRSIRVCVCVYPSSSLGWMYGMSGNSGSCRQPN